MNDSLLALSYVEAYDISYPEALNRIADEVAEIKQTLENTGRFELNDIGTIIVVVALIDLESCRISICLFSSFTFAKVAIFSEKTNGF